MDVRMFQARYTTVIMRLLVDNINMPLRVAQTVFIVLGCWAPNALKGHKKIFFHLYTFISFMLLIGIYVIIQLGDLCQVWGNVPLMTGTIFLLFTNLSMITKVINVYCRKEAIQTMIAEALAELSAERRSEGLAIIQRCNRETNIQLYVYITLTYITILGWIISTEKNELPMRAWYVVEILDGMLNMRARYKLRYPYDFTKSPAYELTYAHQSIALAITAFLNISLDTLVTSLISQCQCRFNLLALSLRTLCDGLTVTDKGCISLEADTLLNHRLMRCVKQHQAILYQAAQLQKFFSIPVLVQFSVSMVIICVTAYQMAVVFESLMWFLAMLAYLGDMLMQVFIYCYHGNQLVTESGKVAGAVYESPWFMCSPAQRRGLLLMMVRAQRETTLRPGKLTELSLATFMAIVKASYTFFTVLQRVEDGSKA